MLSQQHSSLLRAGALPTCDHSCLWSASTASLASSIPFCIKLPYLYGGADPAKQKFRTTEWRHARSSRKKAAQCCQTMQQCKNANAVACCQRRRCHLPSTLQPDSAHMVPGPFSARCQRSLRPLAPLQTPLATPTRRLRMASCTGKPGGSGEALAVDLQVAASLELVRTAAD